MSKLATDIVLPGMKVQFADLDNIRVLFDVMSTSRHITARWKNNELKVVVPPGTRLRDVHTALQSMLSRIMAKRPMLRYHEGQVIEYPEFKVTIQRQHEKPYVVTLTGATLTPVISVGSALDFDDPEVIAMISRMMCRIARKVAPMVLLPRAREIALRLGLSPQQWKISTGRRTLGTCHSDKTISLSQLILFLSPELRDYIICHELAHLTEMNHSARFHQLCDKYLGGREKELIRKLKKYNWPIL